MCTNSQRLYHCALLLYLRHSLCLESPIVGLVTLGIDTDYGKHFELKIAKHVCKQYIGQ